MPSPFPGMDPFIEATHWESFHNRFIASMVDALVPQLRPSYSVEFGQDIYLIRDDGKRQVREPDVAVVKESQEGSRPPGSRAAGATATIEPVEARIPLTRERRHRFIEIRDIRSRDVVTVIELLSPTNKVDRQGRQKYVAKRQDLIEGGVNLVELDLMRNGHRLPILPRLPHGDYFAVVCRAAHAPDAAVYGWSLRDRMPAVPVPLDDDDGQALLNLQASFTEVYDRLGLDYTLAYDADLSPPVAEADHAWLAEIVSATRNMHDRRT